MLIFLFKHYLMIKLCKNIIIFHRGKHFCVYFDNSDFSYFLKDLGRGLGIFYKLKNETPLKNKAVINLDKYFLFISIENNSNELTIKIFTESGENTFEPM